MSADDYTPPERGCEFSMARVKWEKRYKALVERRGLCCVCVHRSREETRWGRNICRVGEVRQYPQCDRDGKGVKFEADAAEVERLKDAA